MGIEILLADDHKIIREGLRSLIESESGMKVVGEADNGRTAVQLALQRVPDIVIMDVSMSELNGIEATRQIIADMPAIKIIALSMHADKRFVSNMLKAGASGYMLKDCAFDELSQAIKTVLDNRTFLSPGITTVVIEDYINHLSSDASPVPTVLTAREREVLQLIAEGGSTKEIAFGLNVSVKTIETHRRQIMDKLHIHSIAELTKYALREGLTSLDT
ncbi:MAG: response regulator transcription factor [Deltaproteobacteria bacterium]|nr:response regulator transcription factor [Deltaproteobacteria bacterium]